MFVTGEYDKDDEEEDGMSENNNNSFSLSADEQGQLTVADDDGGQLDVVAATASGRQASDGDQLNVAAALAGKQRVGEATSSKEAREGGQKKIHAIVMPFKTPRKKSSQYTDNSEEDCITIAGKSKW
jgi:hypothetical protein